MVKAQLSVGDADKSRRDRVVESRKRDRRAADTGGRRQDLVERSAAVERRGKKRQARRLLQAVEPRAEGTLQARRERRGRGIEPLGVLLGERRSVAQLDKRQRVSHGLIEHAVTDDGGESWSGSIEELRRGGRAQPSQLQDRQPGLLEEGDESLADTRDECDRLALETARDESKHFQA